LVVIDGENEVTLPPPLTRVVPVEVVYQSMVHPPGAVALKVTVPEPQRAWLLASVGAAGRAFSLTVCDPVIAAAQYPFSATTCAGYTPAPANAPVKVAALPVPINVLTRLLPLYNWYVRPAAVFDRAKVTVVPVQNAVADAFKSYTEETIQSIAVTAFVRVKSQ
jgi:hypothetical protein